MHPAAFPSSEVCIADKADESTAVSHLLFWHRQKVLQREVSSMDMTVGGGGAM